MELLIFDLDGTLIDSHRDIALAVNYALGRMGRPALDDEIVFSYVGNGAPVLMRRAMGQEANSDEVAMALMHFLEYYRLHLLVHTELYPGVRETLDVFRARGIPMAVLTNKPSDFSQGIVDGLGLSAYFFRVYGGDSFPQKKPDPAGVEKLIVESGARRYRTMMVGDSGVDVRTARNARIFIAGVMYGFQPDSLQADPPDYLLEDMEDLVEIVLGEELQTEHHM